MKSVFPKREFSSFLEAYEVVDRPIPYRMARKSKRGVAPKRVSANGYAKFRKKIAPFGVATFWVGLVARWYLLSGGIF